MVETNPAVSTSSMSIAWVSVMQFPGTVAPYDPTRPETVSRNNTASVPPSSCAST
jgi:hypothetical protein